MPQRKGNTNMRHIETKKLELRAGETIVTVSAFKAEFDNNKQMRGFLSLNVTKDGEFSHSWDNIRVVENKEGKLFISEPQREVMKNEEKTYSPIFLLPKELKQDVNALLNDTFK